MARPGLPRFKYVRAETPDQVLRLLDECGNDARLLLGGTELFTRMRDGVIRPKIVIDIKHLPRLRDIQFDAQAGLIVGAAATMNEIARHPDVQSRFPLLAEAASVVGSYQLRNRATIGGNLCNASPCADTAPATLILDGRLVIIGPGVEREVAAEEFFRGPGETALEPNEFLVAIRYPVPPVGAAGRHVKLGRSRIGDLAIVSVAVFGFPDAELSSGYQFRVALGSVAPTVIRARGAERVLATNLPGEETFVLAAERAAEASAPIDDVRASAAYRKAMAHNIALRGLREVWAGLE